MTFGIVVLYCGASGKKGFYNSQEIGLARAMKKIGYDTVIFYPETSLKNITEEIIEEAVKVVYVPAKAIGVHGRFCWNILLQYKIQVVQIGSDNQIFAPFLLRFCDKNQICAYSYIGTIASDEARYYKRIAGNIAAENCIKVYKVHKCFAKTEFIRSRLSDKGVTDVEVAPVGLDISVIPCNLPDKETVRRKISEQKNREWLKDRKILLFVGRMDEYKRPFEALKLLNSLPEAYCLILIGSGKLNHALEKEIHKLEAACTEPRILWIRKLPNSQIHPYYKSADYFLNFNCNEIFGMSILEAMYQGCTVIASHAPGPDFIIEDKVSGYLTSTTEEMREIILSDSRLRAEDITARISEHFVWDKTAQIFDRWIKEHTASGSVYFGGNDV